VGVVVLRDEAQARHSEQKLLNAIRMIDERVIKEALE
jgi:hypothetical protein